MQPLLLHEFHRARGAEFMDVNGAEAVASYGDAKAENMALWSSVGILDFSFRSRLCLTGADRVRFLHGQVTNDIKALRVGQGCYAALVNAKGRMQGDVNVYCLADELLLDFEAGCTEAVVQRLEKYIVADDVQVTDVAPLYGLLSVQGPNATAVVSEVGNFNGLPADAFGFIQAGDGALGEVYLMNQPRLGTRGFDIFVPAVAMESMAQKLLGVAGAVGGRCCGWRAWETARVEAAIPRFGVDMDETCFPQECGIENRAVSYTKGCYIGQEVLNRVHTMGHVNRELRGLRLANDLPALPTKDDKLFHEGKEVGFVTSAEASPAKAANIALGYVHKRCNDVGTRLTLRTAAGDSAATIVSVPFSGDGF